MLRLGAGRSSGRRFLSSACDAEWALPDARWEKHRPAHAGGVGAQPAGELETRLLYRRGKGGAARRARGGANVTPAAFAWVRGPAVRGCCRRIAVESVDPEYNALADVVRLYDPIGRDSKEVYADIANKLEALVEEAINTRNSHKDTPMGALYIMRYLGRTGTGAGTIYADHGGWPTTFADGSPQPISVAGQPVAVALRSWATSPRPLEVRRTAGACKSWLKVKNPTYKRRPAAS
jgi:hypothetical protein